MLFHKRENVCSLCGSRGDPSRLALWSLFSLALDCLGLLWTLKFSSQSLFSANIYIYSLHAWIPKWHSKNMNIEIYIEYLNVWYKTNLDIHYIHGPSLFQHSKDCCLEWTTSPSTVFLFFCPEALQSQVMKDISRLPAYTRFWWQYKFLTAYYVHYGLHTM